MGGQAFASHEGTTQNLISLLVLYFVILTRWKESFIMIRVATHLEIREFMEKSGTEGLMKKSGKFMKNSQGRVRDDWNCFPNVLENVDIARFISILRMSKEKSYQCYFLLYCWQIGVREKHCKSGKMKTKSNGHRFDLFIWTKILWEIIQAQTFSKNSKMIVISVCPIAKLFAGLTDQMENR